MKKNNLLRMLSALLCMAMLLSSMGVYSEEAIEEIIAEEVITPQPTAEETQPPTEEPTAEPTQEPTAEPEAEVTLVPAAEATGAPDAEAFVDSRIAALKATSPADDYTAALWLYETLIDYATPASVGDTAEDVLLNGSGSALGYARAMQMLLDAYGIENEIVYSDADSSIAWNIAQLDGTWVHIDAYEDDRDDTDKKHFALFDEDIAADHSWDRSSVPASSNSNEAYPADLTVDAIAPTEIVPAENSVTLGVGQTISVADWQLLPEGATSTEEVSYTSSKAKVAKVDANGKVKAVAKGSAVITIKLGTTLKATVAVKVLSAPSSISLSISRTTLGIKETAQLSVTASRNSCTSYTFTSSNPSVATIEDGKVVAVGEGTATITAKSHNDKPSSVKVSVKEAPIYVELNVSEITLGVGESYALSSTLSPGSAGEVTYTCANGNISVDANGKITAVSVGEDIVTATTYNGMLAECTVHIVEAPQLVTLVSKDDRTTFGVGEKTQLIWDVDGRENAPVSFKSSNTRYATVSATGLVTFKKAGKVTVTATACNGANDKITFTCKKAPSSITLNLPRRTLGVGESIELSAKLSSGSAGSYTFKAEGDGHVSINGNVLTAESVGTERIRADTYDKKKHDIETVTVLEAPDSIELSTYEITLGEGETYTLGYNLKEGSAGAVTYTSENGNVSVDAKGKITAISKGEDIVTVTTYNGVSEQCLIHILPAPKVVTLSTDDGRSTYGVKETVQLVWDVDGRENAPVSFKSSNTRYATVSAGGLVTFRKAGKVTITATAYNGANGKVTLTCKKAPSSITLNVPRKTLGVGESIELSAKLSSGSAGSYTFEAEGDGHVSIDGNVLTAESVGTERIRAVTYNNKIYDIKTVTVLEAPDSIELNRHEVSIGVGDSYTLTTTLNEGSAGAFEFAAENSHVRVDAGGRVTAVSEGDCYVTVTTYNGVSDECLVHVTAAPGSITLGTPNDRTSFGVNEKAQLSWATDNGCDGTMKFSSSKSSVVSVSSGGVITAKKTGTATITVKTYNDRTDYVKITVVKAPSSLTLSAERTLLGAGETLQLLAKITSGSAGAVSFTSDNPDVLSVSESGEVTALSAGHATVTAKAYNGRKDSLDFEVRNAPTEIIASPDPLVLRVEDTLSLSAAPAEGSAGKLSFQSLDETIATVDAKGNVSGVSAGKTQIVVSTYVEGVESIVDVEVKPIPTYVQLPWTEVSIGVGDTLQLEPEIDPEVDITTTSFSYTSANTRYATVSAGGVITAKAVGTTTVTVRTHNGISCKLKVIVKKAPSSVRFDPDEITLGVGETIVPATVLTAGTASTLKFESEDPDIVSVGENGTITGVKKGTATVTVTTHNGKSDTCSVTVKAAPAAIALSGTQLLGVGMTAQLSYTLSPSSSSSCIKYEVISGEDVISVDETGLVTALTEGDATVRVSTYLSKVYADLNIAVKPAPTAIIFDAEEYTIDISQTDFQLFPTLEPQDSVTGFTYKMAKSGFFTIDEDGVITPIMRGYTTVTVTTHNGLSASVVVRILDPDFPESVEFAEDMSGISIKPGETYTPTLKVYPEGAKPRMIWSSSNESIATVDPDTGKVTGVAAGKATITGVSQANPAIKLSYNIVVLSDKRCVTEPTMRVTSAGKISSAFTQIKNVRASAYAELSALYANGEISSSEMSTRKDIITRAFDMLLFAWTPDDTEYYWKADNSISGLKDFKNGTYYIGLPYTQTNRTHNRSSILNTGYFDDKGNYYLMNTDEFTQRKYPGNDCSSFVSMSIWGRGNSHCYDATSTIYSASYYKTFTDITKLKPGDILVKKGHVIMFLYFTNSSKTQMFIIEQGGSGQEPNDYSNTVSCSIKDVDKYIPGTGVYIMRKKSGLT